MLHLSKMCKTSGGKQPYYADVALPLVSPLSSILAKFVALWNKMVCSVHYRITPPLIGEKRNGE